MSYMDVLWIKITNSYSKWTPLACTQSLSLCGHSSIELRSTLANLQLPSKETTLNFQYWDVSSCNILFHGQNLSFQQDSTPAHKAWTTQQWLETNVLDFISTSDWPCVTRYLKPLALQIVFQSSGDDLQVETSQYWKFKAVPSEGSCRFSSWCVALMSDHKDFRTVCVLMVVILNNYLRGHFFF